MGKISAIPQVTLTSAGLDKLMPLHLVLDADGMITSQGTTLVKLLDGPSLLGRSVFEAFDLRRPARVTTMAHLRAREGEKLRMILPCRHGPVSFRGIALGQGAGAGMLINLSFGIGVVDVVRSYALTDGDFAPTDLAVEMMYLVEAKSEAMGALRGLAQRLQNDKHSAQVQASADSLTGLGNRRALVTSLDRLAKTQQPFALMHIDLDFFKAVNDTHGHAAGDHVLRSVARVLLGMTRQQDTVARVGGDEFVLIFPGLTEGHRLELTARRIIEKLSQPIVFEGAECKISASIGIALSTQYAELDIEKMHSDADEALYAAKRAGRGRVRLYRAGGDDRRQSS